MLLTGLVSTSFHETLMLLTGLVSTSFHETLKLLTGLVSTSFHEMLKLLTGLVSTSFRETLKLLTGLVSTSFHETLKPRRGATLQLTMAGSSTTFISGMNIKYIHQCVGGTQRISYQYKIHQSIALKRQDAGDE